MPLNVSEQARVVAGSALLAALFVAKEAMFDQADHILLRFWYPILALVIVAVFFLLSKQPKVLLVSILVAFSGYVLALTSTEMLLHVLN